MYKYEPVAAGGETTGCCAICGFVAGVAGVFAVVELWELWIDCWLLGAGWTAK